MKLQCSMHTGQTDSSKLTMKLIPDTGTNETNVQIKKRLDSVTWRLNDSDDEQFTISWGKEFQIGNLAC